MTIQEVFMTTLKLKHIIHKFVLICIEMGLWRDAYVMQQIMTVKYPQRLIIIHVIN